MASAWVDPHLVREAEAVGHDARLPLTEEDHVAVEMAGPAREKTRDDAGRDGDPEIIAVGQHEIGRWERPTLKSGENRLEAAVRPEAVNPARMVVEMRDHDAAVIEQREAVRPQPLEPCRQKPLLSAVRMNSRDAAAP